MYIGCGYKGNFAMVARYADDEELTFYEKDEDDCVSKMADAQDKHGDVTWYGMKGGKIVEIKDED